MDVFELHQHVIDDYAAYTRSFIQISDERIAEAVQREVSEGLLWPEPLLQLNPSFAPGKKVPKLDSPSRLTAPRRLRSHFPNQQERERPLP